MKHNFDAFDVDWTIKALRCLSNTENLMIIGVFENHNRVKITDLVKILNLKSVNIPSHVNALTKYGILTREWEKGYWYYKLNTEFVENAKTLVASVKKNI